MMRDLFDGESTLNNLKDLLFPIRPSDTVHPSSRSFELAGPSSHCLAKSHPCECFLVRRPMQTLNPILTEGMENSCRTPIAGARSVNSLPNRKCVDFLPRSP